MKTKSSLPAFLMLLLLCGCQTYSGSQPERAQEGRIRYSPHEGDQARSSLKVLSTVDVRPIMLFHPGLEFEYDASLRGSSASVVLELQISERGEVSDVQVVEAAPTVVGVAAAKAYRSAKFAPAKVAGKSVPCRVKLGTEFTL